MAKAETAEKETWTTGEELLLACAVKRHGFKNWDSVAMELQTRTSLPLLLTAQNCKQKYEDLKRRFMDNADDEDEETESGDKIDNIPWLDELRKLRVAELRREVHRYDVSILSLQLKVKRLKEEREQSLKENEDKNEKPDLEKDSKEERLDDGKKDGNGAPEKSSPAETAGKSISGEESDRENQSVNGSNSTGAKGENPKTGSDEAEKGTEPAKTGSTEPDPVSSGSKPVGEDSYKGSTDSQAKKGDESRDLRDSVAESKEEEERTKASSDMQSSASLTRKRRREKGVVGCSSGEEPETDEVSPAIKRISVKSEPLVAFLEKIRSHKHSSLFERRLQSQETDDYNSVIRQHLDLQTLQTALQQGSYCSCTRKFFRDLLLLFNNSIVFFPKASVETVAAHELRQLVSIELEKQGRIPPPEPDPSPPLQPQPKPDPERPDSLLAKHKSSAPIIVCRKRSSLSAKASSTGFAKKAELQSDDKKPAFDLKPPVKPSTKLDEEQGLRKKEMAVTGARSLRRSSKSQTNNNTPSKKQSTSPGSNLRPADKGETPKTEKRKKKKKKTDASALAKKRGAADFLKRIKLNSPLKSSGNYSNSGRGGENKRGRSGKGDRRKDRGSGRGGGGKQVKDENSPSKRSVGRPPKKVAESASGKRGRVDTEKEVTVASKRPTKRSRR